MASQAQMERNCFHFTSVAGRLVFPHSRTLAVFFLSAVDDCLRYTQDAVSELESDWTVRHRALSIGLYNLRLSVSIMRLILFFTYFRRAALMRLHEGQLAWLGC